MSKVIYTSRERQQTHDNSAVWEEKQQIRVPYNTKADLQPEIILQQQIE